MSDTAAALTSAFCSTQEHLAHAPASLGATSSGTCALVLYLQRRELWVGSVGDCRAVLGIFVDEALVAPHAEPTCTRSSCSTA